MSEPSLLQRLKERKLVQWAVAYLAGAWVLVEATSLVVGQFHWPELIGQAVTILAVFGFFVVLILAWYHGEKGRQRVSGPELLMVAALLVIAGGLLYLIRGPPATSSIRFTRGGDNLRVIAVLPFDNYSPNPDHAFFASGVQEDLTSKLGGISTLRVIPGTSVERYRDPANRPSIRQIAAELGVDFLLEGSARIGGDSVRITVQLIEGPAEVHLWSEDFDAAYSPEGFVRVQAEIAQRIAYDLRAEVSPEELAWLEAVPTEDLEALEAYMKGNEAFFEERQLGTMMDEFESSQWYRQAIELDGDFALAHARLALSLTWVSGNPLGIQEAGRAAERALSLFPGLLEARVAWARYLGRSGQDEDAIRELRLIEQASPNNTLATLSLALFQREAGEFESGLQSLQRAEQHDPRNPLIQRELQYSYIHAHRYNEALDAVAREAALSEAVPGMGILRRAFIHLARGNRQQAQNAISELVSHNPDLPYGMLVHIPFRVVERLLSDEQREKCFPAGLASGFWYEVDRWLNRAIHEEALGRVEAARTDWDSVTVYLETPPRRALVSLSYLTLAYLSLGEKKAAVETARRATARYDEAGCTSEFSNSWRACELLARTYAKIGEHDAAIDILEKVLPAPSWLTVHILEIDPIWDPLRDHPRFQALLEKYRDDVEH